MTSDIFAYIYWHHDVGDSGIKFCLMYRGQTSEYNVVLEYPQYVLKMTRFGMSYSQAEMRVASRWQRGFVHMFIFSMRAIHYTHAIHNAYNVTQNCNDIMGLRWETLSFASAHWYRSQVTLRVWTHNGAYLT